MSDTKFVDFQLVKEKVSFEQVMQMLGLKMQQSGGQFRSSCPVHGGGERTLVVTPTKGFYCFADKKGGDQIALVAHVRQCGNKEAAQAIASHYSLGQAAVKAAAGPKEPPAPTAKGLQPLGYLEADNQAVQALGVSAETAKLFESGYAAKGVLRGRYAVPIKQKDGSLVAYVGVAVSDEQSPRLQFHNFDPSAVLFNQDAAGASHLTVCRDPLSLILAVENGVPREELVSFLAPITALSLQVLAAFMDENAVETVDLY
jgi:hypothetical protein